jgi:uncharacterized protein with NRDE domain
MCTLIVGWNALGPGTLLIAANRDEDPARPAEGPRALRSSPRIVGGRDARAGGTWLAIRGRRLVVAALNRRDPEPAPADARRPSRGLLALSVAAAGEGRPDHAARAAHLLLGADSYAPCSLVIAGPEGAWLVVRERGTPPRTSALTPGWHALTHAELDDPHEPRAAWLVGQLAGFAPRSVDEALERLGGWLAVHGPGPAVCLHDGRMVTVSTSRVWLTREAARYLHGEGLACRATLEDHSHLLHPE